MRYIPVWTYNDYVSAHVDKGVLESEGIDSWLKDENTVSIDPLLTNAVGGIKLMVAEDEAQRAYTILQDQRDAYRASMACPKCSSHNLTSITSPKKAENWLLAIFTFFFTNVAASAELRYKCFDCGASFDEPVRIPISAEGDAP